jgi:tRNA pseudouridine13 synthase
MKVKQLPEDFQVVELTDLVPGDRGPFAFYLLDKVGWTTADAMQVIRRRWRLEPRRLSCGGLKDRHAQTTQFFTVFHGPRRGLTHQRIRVRYLGQLPEPFTAQDIRANHFQLTLRALSDAEVERASGNLPSVQADGVPNYFDDQRFGSVHGAGNFVARAMVRGQYEEALRLALAAPYEHDRAAQKQEKAILTAHWGDWPACRAELPRGPARIPVDYLCHHPGDFRGALARLPPELRTLYLAAYQSHLWNRILARYIEQHFRPEQIVAVPLRLGPAPMVRDLDADQRSALESLTLPLPTARTHLEPADPRTALVEAVLAEDGLEMSQLRLKGSREMFFSKGDRPAWCRPGELRQDLQADDLHPGRRKLLLHFDLPRGSYATLVVKRLLAGTDPVA